MKNIAKMVIANIITIDMIAIAIFGGYMAAKKIDERRSEETQITVPVVTEETTDTSDSNVTMECLKELRHGNRVCCEAYRNNEKVGSISTRDETYFIEWVLEHEGCTFEIIR